MNILCNSNDNIAMQWSCAKQEVDELSAMLFVAKEKLKKIEAHIFSNHQLPNPTTLESAANPVVMCPFDNVIQVTSRCKLQTVTKRYVLQSSTEFFIMKDMDIKLGQELVEHVWGNRNKHVVPVLIRKRKSGTEEADIAGHTIKQPKLSVITTTTTTTRYSIFEPERPLF